MREARLDRLRSNLPINGHASVLAEVLDGPERRRRWSAEEKARIVAESFAPEALASEVARRHGVHRNQLYTWRREFRSEASGVAFAPVVAETTPSLIAYGIEIAYAGAVIRVSEGADPTVLARVLQTLKRLE